VLDENGVPKETDNQNVDEHDDEEHNKHLEKAGCILDADKIANHL
jgi:hypothetical protein